MLSVRSVCTSGKPKAAVFPVPVRARAITFASPFKRRGIASTCMGEGVTKPLRSIAAKVTSSRPKSSKEISSDSESDSVDSDCKSI